MKFPDELDNTEFRILVNECALAGIGWIVVAATPMEIDLVEKKRVATYRFDSKKDRWLKVDAGFRDALAQMGMKVIESGIPEDTEDA